LYSPSPEAMGPNSCASKICLYLSTFSISLPASRTKSIQAQKEHVEIRDIEEKIETKSPRLLE